jgi:adenylate kinase
MLKGRLDFEDAQAGFILDGFPRTAAQVVALDKLIGEDGLDAVVVFEVDGDALVERLIARGRDDDNEETIRARFGIYQDQTAPLLDVYDKRDLLISINGVGDMDEVTDRITSALADAGNPTRTSQPQQERQ